jgi:Uncharacterized protein conserved in bacteria (DUF2147)
MLEFFYLLKYFKKVDRLRRRQLRNLTILTNFDNEGRAYDGNYYDFKTGKWYKSSLKL